MPERRTKPRLLSIESPFPDAHSMLRLLEPPGTSRQGLLESLFEGTYDKPFIVDDGRRRYLHFDLDVVQSAMDMQHPARLALAYTRKMMAFLLFNQAPGRILLLGLGGGSLAKFCYGHLPSALLTAIEANLDVIALRQEFGIPEDDHRFRVIHADGAAYISDLAPCKNVILADACDRTGIAPQLDTMEFYRNARRCLAPGGVFVANVCGTPRSRAAHLVKLRDAFEDEILTLQVRTDGNLIVFAFKEAQPDLSWRRLEIRATELKRRFGLQFPRYVRRIALDEKLHRW
ncbi:MAG: spermidine synthase-like protein [Gammaproteobacteria bacterium]